jgi:hypothetical protein
MPMNITRLDQFTLAYQPEDQEAAERVRQTCAVVLPMVAQRWGLPPPEDLWVYVMTENWLGDLWRLAPPGWKVLLGLAFWGWYPRTRRMWKYVGGWQQRFGRRRVVGVKPPRLLLASDRSIGERIYLSAPDLLERVQQLACHELIHACTAHLRLPAWLNEGLAMVGVDAYIYRPSIKPETLHALRRTPGKPATADYRRVNVSDPDALIYLYVRGYWIVRYLEETQPGLLRGLLERRLSHRALEKRLAQALGMDRGAFWQGIDARVAAHFNAGREGE